VLWLRTKSGATDKLDEPTTQLTVGTLTRFFGVRNFRTSSNHFELKTTTPAGIRGKSHGARLGDSVSR
jgi:hypothetical protein